MSFFKPKDFEGLGPITFEAARIANAKLEREAKVVYGIQGKYYPMNMHPNQNTDDTHKALLLNIEPINQHKCPTEFVCGDCFKKFDLKEQS